MSKVNCEIVRDIIPLYIDDACSEESRNLIEEHIKHCSECKKILELMNQDDYKVELDITSENRKAMEIVKKINNKIIRKQIMIAVVTAIIIGGVWAYFNLIETTNPYKNYFVTEISNLDDIMYYFKYAFFPYVVLFIIVIINFFKAVFYKKNEKNSSGWIDLAVGVLCGIAMGAGLLFQGVLADNNAPDYMGWCNALAIISVLSFIIFIINLIVLIKKSLYK